MRRTIMSAADAPPAPTRADKIIVAITEARKLVHGLGGHNGHA
jgi:hypothetical protein